MSGDTQYDQIKDAVAEGIRDALSDPVAVKAFWDGAFIVLNQHAQQKTGELVIGGLKGLLRKGLLFMVAGLIVYNIGGWTLLVTTWKALFSGH